jgi:hypothetical protein
MIVVLVIILLFVILILGLSYPFTANMMGHEVAERQTLHTALVIFLFAVPIASLYYFVGNNAFVITQILFSIIFIFDLLNLPFYKRKSGALLLDIGKDELWSVSLMSGLLWLGMTVLNASSFFRHVSTGFPQDTNFVTEASELSFYFSLGISLVLKSLGKTEFRKNGIWFSIGLIKWQRMKFYKWEASKPNIVTIRYQPSFPFFLGWMSFPIPLQYREDVSRILNDRLSNENL